MLQQHLDQTNLSLWLRLKTGRRSHCRPGTTAPGGRQTRAKVRNYALMLECTVNGIKRRFGLTVQIHMLTTNYYLFVLQSALGLWSKSDINFWLIEIDSTKQPCIIRYKTIILLRCLNFRGSGCGYESLWVRSGCGCEVWPVPCTAGPQGLWCNKKHCWTQMFSQSFTVNCLFSSLPPPNQHHMAMPHFKCAQWAGLLCLEVETAAV